ncbi:MAG: hypothetical protein Q8P28_10760 [Deltaproteobacteria bacterium]|nr:hypothetical protein [Deltaproteobacteria bacterium]
MINTEVRSQQVAAGFSLRLQRNLKVAATCLLLTVLTGCASTKGHPFLTPLPTTLPGYSITEQNIVFSNNDVKVSISPLNSSETKKLLTGKDANNPLIEILTQPGYFVFLLDIENSSKAKVMYNPSLTTLFDNNMGLHKPLDYTDLYTLLGNLPNPETTINVIKDIIYDLTITLAPGQRTSRLLLFSGIDEEASEAAITMKEIYIGTSTIALSFGFKITEESKEASK